MIIKDNFLVARVHDNLFKTITSPNFPWYYQNSMTRHLNYLKGQQDNPYFSHLFYSDHQPLSNYYEDIVTPLIITLGNVKSIMVVRANLYIKKDRVYSSRFHTDDCEGVNKYNHKTAIFYVNRNNGYTKFEDGKKVESIPNRMLIFDASLKHCAVTQMDDDRRIVININYIEK